MSDETNIGNPYHTELRAFNGDPGLKEALLKEVQWHQDMDHIRKLQYWNVDSDGVERGCSVGCTIKGIISVLGIDGECDNHAMFEYVGIPAVLAHLDDLLFENIRGWQTWPKQFLEAIPVGADLSLVTPKLLYWLLTDGMKDALAESLPNIASLATKAAGLWARVIDGERVPALEFYDMRDTARVTLFRASFGYSNAALAISTAVDTSSMRGPSNAIGNAADEFRGPLPSFYESVKDKLLELLRNSPVPSVTEREAYA